MTAGDVESIDGNLLQLPGSEYTLAYHTLIKFLGRGKQGTWLGGVQGSGAW